jgi:hypothetical protein
MTNQEIAEALFLSINTIKTHLSSVYRKLGVANRRQAIAQGRRLDLLLRGIKRHKTMVASPGLAGRGHHVAELSSYPQPTGYRVPVASFFLPNDGARLAAPAPPSFDALRRL